MSNSWKSRISQKKWIKNSPSPPPSVVFSSEVEVTEKNSRLRARDDKDNCYQEQEAKHVVDL